MNAIVKVIEEIELGYGKLMLCDDGIMRHLISLHPVFDMVEARRLKAGLLHFAGEKKRPLFVDARTVGMVSREVREFMALDDVNNCLSAYGTLDNSIMRMLGGLFIKLNKPPYPFRFFSSEEAAIEWLRGYVD